MQIIKPPVFSLIASLWVITPYGVDKIAKDDRKELDIKVSAFSDTLYFFDGVDTNLMDLKKGLCLKKGIVNTTCLKARCFL